MQGFRPSSFAKTWYGIEHNIHSLKGKCMNSMDEFRIAQDGSITIIKSCIDKEGRKDQSLGNVQIPDKSDPSKMVITFPRAGILGTSSTVRFIVLDTDYDTYAIVSNGDGKTFRILGSEPRMELCRLGEIEVTVASMGFDISDVIREHGSIIPCNGKGK